MHYFPSKDCSKAFGEGFDSMFEKIKGMGFEASRQEFNSIHPPGKPFSSSISELGQWFAKGEAEALIQNAPR